MTEYTSQTIDRLVDAIDALIVLRAERADTRDIGKATDDFRTQLADVLCDFVAALREEAVTA